MAWNRPAWETPSSRRTASRVAWTRISNRRARRLRGVGASARLVVARPDFEPSRLQSSFPREEACARAVADDRDASLYQNERVGLCAGPRAANRLLSFP